MSVFFTADTHFGDPHILRQRGGVFRSLAEHDEVLIARWNAVVKPADDVWHIGDFAAGASRERCAEIFARLAGRKRLVRGNHDTNRVLALPWADAPVESVRITVRDDLGVEWRLFLAHYAHRAWPGLWRGTRHLYGHTHATLADTSRSAMPESTPGLPAGRDRRDHRGRTPRRYSPRKSRENAAPSRLPRAGEGVGTQ